MTRRVSVNGRYIGKRMTGVQRYAHEVVTRLGERCEVVRPERPQDGVRGHLWEAALLPTKLRGRLLFSPCNTGPLALRNQVLTVHDTAFIDTPECFSRAFATWYAWLIPKLVRRVRRVITVSNFSRDRIADVSGLAPDRIDVIPNGVEARFKPAPVDEIDAVRRLYDLPGPYVLTLGSVEPRKNLPTLLKAWRQVAARRPDLTLAIAGGSGLSIYRDAGIDAAPPGVKRLGFVDDALLPALYSGCETFVFPSMYEGFGLPPLEAMACGAAVVCSNATSLPEVVGDDALLVSPKDPEEMAAAILRVTGDRSLQAALRAAGPRRAAPFCWDKTAAQTWNVLARAAALN